jgi:hypothetical protein
MLFDRIHTQVLARRLLFTWGVLTGVYLATVIFRALTAQQSVGVSTYAGVSAVAGVWFALFDTVYPRGAVRSGALVSLMTSVVLNTSIITRAVATSHNIPMGRSLFTLALAVGLLETTLQTQRAAKYKGKE